MNLEVILNDLYEVRKILRMVRNEIGTNANREFVRELNKIAGSLRKLEEMVETEEVKR